VNYTYQVSVNRYMTILDAYAPTLTSDEDAKDRFYDSLRATLRSVTRDDKVILLGDFNARVGSNYHVWKGLIGRHGLGNASKCI